MTASTPRTGLPIWFFFRLDWGALQWKNVKAEFVTIPGAGKGLRERAGVQYSSVQCLYKCICIYSISNVSFNETFLYGGLWPIWPT